MVPLSGIVSQRFLMSHSNYLQRLQQSTYPQEPNKTTSRRPKIGRLLVVLYQSGVHGAKSLKTLDFIAFSALWHLQRRVQI